MAGRGSRFSKAGFTTPKPLLPLGGKPMIQWVIENITPKQPHRFIFICQEEHLFKYPEEKELLTSLCPDSEIITLNKVTEGAACTVLLARDLINSDDPLMIANSDQFVDLPIDEYLNTMETECATGLIMTFWADHPKWSYCRMDNNNIVTEVVEKQVISNEATVGIYNYAHGKDFVQGADRMIEENFKVNGEFYVAPVYNYLIADDKKVVVKSTGKEFSGMYGLGTPNDYSFFQSTDAFSKNCTSDFNDPLSDQKKKLGFLTKHYVKFFNERNRAGIDAIFNSNIKLTDPIGSFIGKKVVLEYIYKIFEESQKLEFEAKNIFVDGNTSVIEFILEIDDKKLQGTDVVEWRDSRISDLRAYLY